MQVQNGLTAALLFFCIVSNVAFAFHLGLIRPAWLMSFIALASMSLIVLTIFVFTHPVGNWFWTVSAYSVIYPILLVGLGVMLWPMRSIELPPAMTETSLEVPIMPLQSWNGQAVLLYPSNVRRTLHRAGQPMPALLPGWLVETIDVECAPLLIISLINEDGVLNRWVIDELSETYNEPISQLPARIRNSLRAATQRRFQAICDHDDGALASWNRIPRTTRLELLADTECQARVGEEGLIQKVGAWVNDTSQTLRVCNNDNFLSVLYPNGLEIPILMQGSVLRHSDFQPGWAAEALYRDFAPFFLLELRHENGTCATWLLDHHLSFIDDIKGIAEEVAKKLGPRATPVMERHLASVLAFADPASDPVVERYLKLSDDTRRALAVHYAGEIRLIPAALALRHIPSVLPLPAMAGKEVPCLLRQQAIEQAVTTDLHRQTIKAVLDSCLEWPSPVDGSPAALHGIFVLDEYTFFYQFVDRNGVNFVVIASDRSAKLIGLVIPSINLILFDDHAQNIRDPNGWMRDSLGGEFWWLLVHHINHYANDMAFRKRTGQACPVNVLLTSTRLHIGHHLWNDLSGLEALCYAVPLKQVPVTIIIGAADGRAEFFGPLETLCPATAGRIDRSLENIEAFIRWTYRNDVWPARITREYVSAALRRNILNHLAEAEEVKQLQAELSVQQWVENRPPIIIFGLRVEDRTLVDLYEFCVSFVTFILERYPGATIVFDGYNCRPGTTSGPVNPGMVYHLTSQPAEEFETALVMSLTEHFAGMPITVVGTTGHSIATSLTWCRHADAAFAIWGAGLSKIRWIANLPTMFITSRGNLLHRCDLGIYRDPAFMETPRPVLFPDPSLITDMHEHRALASRFIQGGRECFSVHTNLIFSAFDGFLKRLLQDRDLAEREIADRPVSISI